MNTCPEAGGPAIAKRQVGPGVGLQTAGLIPYGSLRIAANHQLRQILNQRNLNVRGAVLQSQAECIDISLLLFLISSLYILRKLIPKRASV